MGLCLLRANQGLSVSVEKIKLRSVDFTSERHPQLLSSECVCVADLIVPHYHTVLFLRLCPLSTTW